MPPVVLTPVVEALSGIQTAVEALTVTVATNGTAGGTVNGRIADALEGANVLAQSVVGETNGEGHVRNKAVT